MFCRFKKQALSVFELTYLKMTWIPRTAVSVVPSLYVHLPSSRPAVPGAACWEHTASWGRRSFLKAALQSLDPGGFAFADLLITRLWGLGRSS